MNAEDDPMLKKIVSAALPNLPNYNVKVLAVSPFSYKEHGAKREFHPMFKPFVILFVGIHSKLNICIKNSRKKLVTSTH